MNQQLNQVTRALSLSAYLLKHNSSVSDTCIGTYVNMHYITLQQWQGLKETDCMFLAFVQHPTKIKANWNNTEQIGL